MQNMIDFTVFILGKIPEFLMAEPICYIMACCIGCFIIKLFRTLCHI